MPKKVYAKSNLNSKSMCRLCCSIIDPKHCKKLYNKASVNVLASAELLYSGFLLRDSLPHLVCQPCERRLDNFMKFKNMICDNQDSMMRQKRCIELSLLHLPLMKRVQKKTHFVAENPLKVVEAFLRHLKHTLSAWNLHCPRYMLYLL